MAKFEEEVEKLNIKGIIITMVLSALGFLVAFSWRDAIKETIELFLPKSEGLLWKYISAIIITAIAVITSYILIKLQRANIVPDKYEEKIKLKRK
ncbi:MAG TPA: hypothetical protein ENG42_00590 [Candidatus Aenigmarchaeota archaeon]|nr:MAG: hypothetical protein DRP03_00980 [Candidatus Aenigmarchaeota archaeon]HDD45949.1 hypothetical protein [Candidatus Aenigmarchaeota archaeon]